MSYDNRHPTGRPDLTGESDRDALEATWNAIAPDGPAPAVAHLDPDTDAAWASLSDRLFGDDAVSTGTPDIAPIDIGRRWNGIRIAGFGAAAAAVAALVFSVAPVTESAAPGEIRVVTLPAGSTIELNAGAEATWRRGFGWIPGVSSDRTVRLRGEAFFDVVSDGTTFSVRTRDAEVTVLGTRFNVRAHLRAPTRVTVEEGRVAVADLGGLDRIELSAGQGGGLLPGGGLALDPRIDLRDLAWRDGGLTLRDLSVAEILEALELRFGTRIDLRSDEDADERLTLHYSERVDLETVLSDLAAARELEYARTDAGWELYRE